MADMSLPPWLVRDYNPVETFMRSFATGAQIGEEQSRLAETQRQANMRAIAQKEALQANILRAQVELQVQDAYHQQQLALRQAELEQVKRHNEATAQKAAADLQERMAYHQMLTGLREREVVAKEQGREYGDVTTVDIPGLPGVKGVFRPGSPGVHVVKPATKPSAKITIRDPLTGESITAHTDDPALDAFRRAHNETPAPAQAAPSGSWLDRILGRSPTIPATNAPPASLSGKRFRYDPSKGSIFELTNSPSADIPAYDLDQEDE